MKLFAIPKLFGRLARPVTKPAARQGIKWTRRLVIWFENTFSGEPARRRRRARQLAAGLSAELHRLGFSRRVAVGGHRRRKVAVRRVRFESPLLLTREELWLPIDLKRLPVGVTTNDLREEDILKSIEDRLNTSVKVSTLGNGRLCYVLRVAAGSTFPEVFAINAFKLPPDAPALAMPLGIDGQGDHRWADLSRMPHLLIVGPTGKGKSTFVHAFLTTWISRNTDKDIEIWLADHKGGVELDRYKVLMGSRGRPGIVRRMSYKPEDTIELLQAALKELERRNELLRQSGAADVDDYARSTGQFMRRIVVAIDEIFFLMLNKEKIDPEVGKGKSGGMTVASWAEHLFAKIASAGRAAGVHLIIATQRTGKDVLTPLITANFETRLVFGMADMYQSIYVIGSSDAVGLPRGRALFREEGGALSEVQTPLIKADQTRLALSRISRYGPDGGLGKADEAKRFRDEAKLLIVVASEEFEGRVAINQIYQHERLRGVIRKDRIDEICRRLEKDGVLDPGGPRRARRVSAAFIGRPQLLDSLYGDTEIRSDDENTSGDTSDGGRKTPGRGPDVSTSVLSDTAPEVTYEAHQDGINDQFIDNNDTSYVRPVRAHIAPVLVIEGEIVTDPRNDPPED
jgi:DNA polymerase III delta prime subunit